MDEADVILIGGGIMSANLGALLKKLDPSLKIQLFEVAEEFANEASNGWHNAGTGHGGLCELSYTPDRGPDGEVKVDKAIEIFEEFEQSLQFWASAVREGMIDSPTEFINPVPHLSFVHGEDGVDFLTSRFQGLKKHHFFESMTFTSEREEVHKWAPLLVESRSDEPVATTKMEHGTDINFGSLSRKLIAWLGSQEGCQAHLQHRVTDLTEIESGWQVSVRDDSTGKTREIKANFVFIGAGGGSLPLLQKSGIPEAKGYGAFPIGGQWLICQNPKIVSKHHAKVYGAALGSAPTMAVPHLDTRVIDGKRSLLFGPYGSWTTKFLHEGGSFLDVFKSVRPGNIWPLIKTGICNLPLVGYLIGQGLQSMNRRLDELRRFYPDAQAEDWKLIDAGIRVQTIKSVDGDAGIVHFGTEVLTDQKGSISALLGASPGASVSVNVMLQVIEKCFPHLVKDEQLKTLLTLIPSYNRDLKSVDEADFFRTIHESALRELHLT
ncbi:malate dehydrogenase (quinone) (plasmid) [Verrucomicrobiaceae bacterium 227]